MSALSVILCIVALIFACGVAFSEEAVHSALCLTGNLLCVALIYLTLSLQFLAMAQLVIYAGAIMVVFLFAVTVLSPEEASFESHKDDPRWLAVLFGAALGAMLLCTTWTADVSTESPTNLPGQLQDFAKLLFGKYMFVFEATAVVLLIALIAATLLSHRRFKVTNPQSSNSPASNLGGSQ